MPSASATVTASANLQDAPNAIDGTGEKRWIAPTDVKSAWLELDLGKPTRIAAFGIDEPDVWPRLKQKYKLEAADGTTWKVLSSGDTNGHGLKNAITPVIAQKFRLTIERDKGSPGIAEIQLYRPE